MRILKKIMATVILVFDFELFVDDLFMILDQLLRMFFIDLKATGVHTESIDIDPE